MDFIINSSRSRSHDVEASTPSNVLENTSMKYLDNKIHKHHIVPRYKCKELGINPDFPENIVELTEREHAHIHWWMYLNEREDVFNLLQSKGVEMTSFLTEHIPFGNRNDSGAATYVAKGQIDGIDMSGENNPAYIDGRTLDWKAYMKIYNKEHYQKNKETILSYNNKRRQTPEVKAKKKEYDARPEVVAKRKELRERPEVKAREKERRQTPEVKARIKEYRKTYYLRKKERYLTKDTKYGILL